MKLSLCAVGGVLLVTACGRVAPVDDGKGPATRDGKLAPRATETQVGKACTPSVEDQPGFAGFDDQYTYLETYGQSGDPVCLIDHFRGRVSCPFGQDVDGSGFDGGEGCATPSGERVVGGNGAWHDQWIEPQCRDRRAADVVYTSCRCANADGRTDDGDHYCGCPDGLACAPLPSVLGIAGDLRAGSYCRKPSLPAYEEGRSCQALCNRDTCE